MSKIIRLPINTAMMSEEEIDEYYDKLFEELGYEDIWKEIPESEYKSFMSAALEDYLGEADEELNPFERKKYRDFIKAHPEARDSLEMMFRWTEYLMTYKNE